MDYRPWPNRTKLTRFIVLKARIWLENLRSHLVCVSQCSRHLCKIFISRQEGVKGPRVQVQGLERGWKFVRGKLFNYSKWSLLGVLTRISLKILGYFYEQKWFFVLFKSSWDINGGKDKTTSEIRTIYSCECDYGYWKRSFFVNILIVSLSSVMIKESFISVFWLICSTNFELKSNVSSLQLSDPIDLTSPFRSRCRTKPNLQPCSFFALLRVSPLLLSAC